MNVAGARDGGGMWRSLVAHLTGGQGVAGSNPVIPTISVEQGETMSMNPQQGNGTAMWFLTELKVALIMLTTLAMLGYPLSAAETQRRGGSGERERRGESGEMQHRGGSRNAQRRGGPGGLRALLGPIRRLGLSEVQGEQIRAILKQNAEILRTTDGKVRAGRRALREAVMSDGVNEGEIRSLAAELATLEGDAAVEFAKLYVQVLELLTPDQQARLAQMRADMKANQEDRG